jgi:hypothetical protein
MKKGQSSKCFCVAPLALRDGLRRKEEIVETPFRHDFAALAR